MKRILLPVFLLLPSVCLSAPFTLGPEKASSHKLFISSNSNTNTEQFDIWQIDSGYSYNVFESLDLYVGASITSASSEKKNGFLSGMSYQFSENITLKSSLRAQANKNDPTEEKQLSAEVTSRLKISDHVDLHATFDYEEWQQGVEVGLGFSF